MKTLISKIFPLKTSNFSHHSSPTVPTYWSHMESQLARNLSTRLNRLPHARIFLFIQRCFLFMHWLLSLLLDVISHVRVPTQCCRFKSCVRPSYSMIILVVNHACIDRPPFLFIDRLARLHQASQRIDACSSPSLVDSSLQFQPRCLAGGWVNEQLCFSIFLISGGRDTDPAVAGKAAFVFFSSGWLVRNLGAQGAKIWLQ